MTHLTVKKGPLLAGLFVGVVFYGSHRGLHSRFLLWLPEMAGTDGY